MWKSVEICNGANEGCKAGGRGGEACGGGEVIRRNDAEGIGGERREGRIFGFESGAELAEGGEASMRAWGGERLGEGVEEEGVGLREGSGAGGCGMGAEVGLREGDGKGGVGGEVESWVSFSPVSRFCLKREIDTMGNGGGGGYLITAILTGAVVLAR